MKEVGTLKELNVKPGDVVEYKWFTGDWVKGEVDLSGIVQMYDGNGKQDPEHSTDPNWRIVSRAIDTPKLWRDMTPEEKGALLLARHEGKDIEYKRFDDVWCVSCGDFVDYGRYRFRPEPKVETHKHVVFAHGEGRATKYNTIDGKVDWSSFEVMGK